jgi:dihydroxyacetone kinase-like predicted kinase
MQSLSIIQLQKMLVAFCDHIITHKTQINNINVYPVPDQDTGSNLAVTLKAVKRKLQAKKYSSIKELSDSVQKTALYSAQGNSGIIITAFISGFFDELKIKSSITPESFYEAVKTGTVKAYSSIEKPQKGTILDVMDSVVSKMKASLLQSDCTMEKLLYESFVAGNKALNQTMLDMAVLKESKVVDAGALAFVMMIESFYESITGKQLEISEENSDIIIKKSSSSILTNQFEVVFILEESMMNQDEIKEMLVSIGDSIDIIDIVGKIKVHIHTDQPETVKEIAHSLGTIVYLQHSDMKEEKIIELIDLSTRT